MSKTLTNDKILKIIREEIDARFEKVIKEVVTTMDLEDPDTNVISPGLKIRHKKSGLLYTVTRVTPHAVSLYGADSQTEFDVGTDEFKKEYELD